MAQFKKTSIQQRFVTGLAVAITVTVLTFSVGALAYLTQATRADLDRQLDRMTTLSHQSLSSALWQFNLEYVSDYIDSLFLYDDIVFAQVATDQAVVKTKTREGFTDVDFSLPEEIPGFLIRQSTISHEGFAVGTIRLVATKARIREQVTTVSLVAITLLIISIALIAMTAYGLFRTFIYTPISHLEASAERIARGEWDAPIDTGRADEIGHLARTFQDMIQNIKAVTASRDELNQEIAERERAETALRFARYVIDSSSEAAFWMGPDARFRYVNKAACHSLGYTEEELLTMTVHDIDPLMPVTAWPEHWQELQEKKFLIIESHHRTKGDVVFPVELSLNYYEYEGEEFNCAFARDLTERKRAEAGLRDSEHRFRKLFEQAAVGVAQIESLTGRFARVNRRYCEILGYDAEELTRVQFQTITHPDDLPQNMANMQRMIEGTVPEFSMDKRYIRKDGSPVWVTLTASPMWQPGQSPDYHIAIAEDITDRKEAEERVNASLKEKEVLLREIHHRVKNNMQIIQSLLSLHGDKINDPAMKQVLADSNNRIRSMALIHETLYRSEDLGKLDIQAYFHNIAQHLFKIYHRPDQAIELNIETHPLPLDLDRCIACGLIINELVSNALKHAFVGTPGGSLAISFYEIPDAFAELTVSDTGSGLPDGFDIDTSDSLGIKIVRILAMHQLKGTLSTTGDDGASFSIRFPLATETQ